METQHVRLLSDVEYSCVELAVNAVIRMSRRKSAADTNTVKTVIAVSVLIRLLSPVKHSHDVASLQTDV